MKETKSAIRTFIQVNSMLSASLWENRRIVKAGLPVNLFLTRYMGKFKMQNVDGRLILHSHLPPINSPAFSRFVSDHLLEKIPGPTHAQVSVTNRCPQKCQYCYNRDRSGTCVTTGEILEEVRALVKMGVVWLGFTGGEPLLQPDLPAIIRAAGDRCATKVFTTGCGLTETLAGELKEAGLTYVSVSLDHWDREAHDRVRGMEGAFDAALAAIRLFLAKGFHVSISTVLPRPMIRDGSVIDFLEFLAGLGVHEAWLSEAKPSVEAFWDPALVITEEERQILVRLQDDYNRSGRLTVNYLGHFEGKEHFGCNAGHKMVYVDAFGEVSPCVFTPMTFGNVRARPLSEIVADMRLRFPSESDCFINKNYDLLRSHSQGRLPLSREQTLAMLEDVRFGPLSTFARRHYGTMRGKGERS